MKDMFKERFCSAFVKEALCIDLVHWSFAKGEIGDELSFSVPEICSIAV